SADLTGSVLTNWSGSKPIGRGQPGNYVHFVVREFAITPIPSGLALHGGIIPYVGTFLTFSDYARNAVRMAALMKLRSILIYTHDSIGLGEGGPPPPGGGACGPPAPHPRARRLASVRHHGNRGRLGRSDRAQGRADRAPAHPARRRVPAARRRAMQGHPPRRRRARPMR